MSNQASNNKVLVTGSGGQLGQSIKKIEKEHSGLNFCFTNSKELDITKKENIQKFFRNNYFDFVINCAAYANVEQAEKEPEKAFIVNAEGAKNIAEVCKEYGATLIHISTDYVFDGEKKTPYTEEDVPNPINEYGKSKLAGERFIQDILEKYFIVRTSWLYSEFGHNFYRTILEKSKTEKELVITTGETGSPTYAGDLASFLIEIIKKYSNNRHGIYHYTGGKAMTWYDFAKEILEQSGNIKNIILKKTDNYSTFAKRPKYSVLDTRKTMKYSLFKTGKSFKK